MDFLKKQKHVLIAWYVIGVIISLVYTDFIEGDPSFLFEVVYSLLWPLRLVVWVLFEAVWIVLYTILEVFNYTVGS